MSYIVIWIDSVVGEKVDNIVGVEVNIEKIIVMLKIGFIIGG